jgi:4-hydroxybenzoate polyprenyltransferase
MGWKRVRLSLEMIKFEHSIFALPFALTGALLAFREQHAGLSFALWKVLWIVVAMVGARSAAMAFNRVLDATIDGRNPRTRMRHLPAGILSPGFVWGFIAVSVSVFFLAAWALNRLCLELAPVALAIVFFYSYTKRFTSLSHLVLGIFFGYRAGSGVDRRDRFARLAHSVANRRRDVLDWRVRCHLLLPGL